MRINWPLVIPDYSAYRVDDFVITNMVKQYPFCLTALIT